MNGYQLRVLYYDSEGKYHVSIEKDGMEAGFETYPATGEKGWEYPDLETAHTLFNDALKTKEKELYDKPVSYLEQVIEERCGMNTEELYTLPSE